ncbi:MAG: HAMP domain-containing histidine kinase [Bacteroidia bacterium]|nr:HAMP domain-containing histidine kinase [Bacteroidia bacterium]
MTHSLRKLESFIKDITDYAKNKRQQLKIEKIGVEQMFVETLDGLRFLPHFDRVTVQLEVSGTSLYTDRTRLEIILKNLLSNAYRYMDYSKTQSTIKIEAKVNDDYGRIKITDNGIGIDSRHVPKIFNMFYRAVEHSQGTGIGLFLVKESVKMLRGKISVKSSLGEWTVFYFTVPNLRKGLENIPESEAVIVDAELH